MAVDVFHIHDGVIHQQTQRQDQREQRHPVDGVAEDQVEQERHPQRHGHGDGDDEGLADAQRHGQQHDDDDHRDEQVAHQLVDLVVGGLAVVPGDGHGDIVGHDRMVQGQGSLAHILGHHHGVGAAALGDGDGDG